MLLCFRSTFSDLDRHITWLDSRDGRSQYKRKKKSFDGTHTLKESHIRKIISLYFRGIPVRYYTFVQYVLVIVPILGFSVFWKKNLKTISIEYKLSLGYFHCMKSHRLVYRYMIAQFRPAISLTSKYIKKYYNLNFFRKETN